MLLLPNSTYRHKHIKSWSYIYISQSGVGPRYYSDNRPVICTLTTTLYHATHFCTYTMHSPYYKYCVHESLCVFILRLLAGELLVGRPFMIIFLLHNRLYGKYLCIQLYVEKGKMRYMETECRQCSNIQCPIIPELFMLQMFTVCYCTMCM